MKLQSKSAVEEGTFRQYLLRGLSEAEQTQVEERIFMDEAFYEQLCLVEDELIDSYVGELLSPAERARFEEQFLTSPRRRERIEFARAFRNSLAKTKRTASARSLWAALLNWIPTWNTAAWVGSAAAALLLVMFVGGRFNEPWNRSRQPPPPTQARAEPRQPGLTSPAQSPVPSHGNDAALKELQARLEQAEAERRRHQGELAQRKFASPLVFSFVLTPGLVRDEKGVPQLRVPTREGTVQLELELEAAQPGPYRVVLRTLDGLEIWSQDREVTGRARPNSAVLLRVPARLLGPDDYHLILSRQTASGIWEEAGDYFFRVRNG